jgi:hypothetical protein
MQVVLANFKVLTKIDIAQRMLLESWYWPCVDMQTHRTVQETW